jgi:hypothetical protein
MTWGGEPVVVPASTGSSPSPQSATTYRANDENDWKFLVSINPWFIFLNGTITVRGETESVDVNFDNIWKHLHMAMFADVDVQKGNFGLFTDVSWARLWQRVEGPLITTKVDLDWALFDFGLYYEVLNLKLGSGSMPPRLRLQPYFGGRYQYFGTEVDVRTALPNRGGSFAPVSHTAAPILGLRGFLDINEHWNLSFAGDGGGFGVDGLDVTWLGEAMVGYRFRFFQNADFNVMVGYKGVGVDVKSGTKDIESDLTFHAPVLKVGVEF